MKKQKTNIWRLAIAIFKDKKLFSIFAINLILAVLIIISSSFFYVYISKITIDTGSYLQFMQPDTMTDAQLADFKSTLTDYVVKVVLSSSLLSLVCLIFFTIFSSIGWNKLLKKQNTAKRFFKFFLVNIIMTILCSLLIFGLFKILLVKAAYISSAILLVLLFYLAPIFYYNLFKENKIMVALKKIPIAFKRLILIVPFLCTLLLIIISAAIVFLLVRYVSWIPALIMLPLLITFSLSYYKTFIFESLQIIE